MLEFVEKAGRLIDGRKGFEQGNVFPLREERGQRERVDFLLPGCADVETAVGAKREERIAALRKIRIGFFVLRVERFIERL